MFRVFSQNIMKKLQDVIQGCPRTYSREVLRVNVTERLWHSSPFNTTPISFSPVCTTRTKLFRLYSHIICMYLYCTFTNFLSNKIAKAHKISEFCVRSCQENFKVKHDQTKLHHWAVCPKGNTLYIILTGFIQTKELKWKFLYRPDMRENIQVQTPYCHTIEK